MKAAKLRIGPSYELRFDPESRRAISFGSNISVWDLKTGKRTARAHPLKHPSHVHWSPNGDSLSVKSTSGELILVSAETLQITARLQTKRAGEGSEAVFSPSGDRLLDGTWEGMLATYEVASQSRQLEHSFPNAMITSIEPSWSSALAAVVVHQKSSTGRSPEPQHSICIAEWSRSGLAMRTIGTKFHDVKATAFDRSERRLAIMRRDGSNTDACIDIVDVMNGQTIASRACVLSPNGSSLGWSPDGDVIGIVEKDGFRFYDVPDLKEIVQLPMKYASHIEFSRDGKYIALGAWSGGEIRFADSVLRMAVAQTRPAVIDATLT
jgi:WD40 repeat protein